MEKVTITPAEVAMAEMGALETCETNKEANQPAIDSTVTHIAETVHPMACDNIAI